MTNTQTAKPVTTTAIDPSESGLNPASAFRACRIRSLRPRTGGRLQLAIADQSAVASASFSEPSESAHLRYSATGYPMLRWDVRMGLIVLKKAG